MSIKLKIGACIDCCAGTKPQPLTAGRCRFHYWKYRNSLSPKKPVLKKPYAKPKAIKKKTNLLFTPPPELLHLFCTPDYYTYHILQTDFVCENCKTYIICASKHDQISAQAHILPKNKFITFKNLIANHLTLCFSGICCHQKWDKSWESAKTMPVFDAAFAKIEPFLHLLSAQESRILRRIFDQTSEN